MICEATELGANAVVSVRFATSVIMDGAAEMLAYGTAVIVEDESFLHPSLPLLSWPIQ